MTQSSQAIIFDFDGVLADTLPDLLGVSEIVCARLGFPCQPVPEDLNALDRMSFYDLGLQLGVPETHIEAYQQGCFELFLQRHQPLPTFPGMVEAVQSCANHSRLGVVTGNVTATVWKFLRHHGIEACFEEVLGIDLPGSRVEKIRSLVAHLGGLPGSRVYMVGDAVSDIRAAREAGIRSVAVGWGHQTLEKLAALNPDRIAHTPQELSRIMAEESLEQGEQA